MEMIEWSGFRESCRPREIQETKTEKYNAETAEELRQKKRQYVKDIYNKLGPEAYVKIAALLHKRCFDGVEMESVSRHIMHRALSGTTIDQKKESNIEFVYDMHDRVLETLMSYVACVQDVEHAEEVIRAIAIDFDNFDKYGD